MGASIDISVLKLFEADWCLLSDLIDFIAGASVGEGESRMVFNFNLVQDPKMVIKIEKGSSFNNISEWDIWHSLNDSKMAEYLAPCVNISSCGKFLIQEKTEPIKHDQLPKEIPSFFTDTKLQNWGMLKGRPVCHDYANHKFYSPDLIKMVKADWWSDQYQIFTEKPVNTPPVPEAWKEVVDFGGCYGENID